MDFLPAETLEEILQNLSARDLLNFRKTSKGHYTFVKNIVFDRYRKVIGNDPIDDLQAFTFWQKYRSIYLQLANYYGSSHTALHILDFYNYLLNKPMSEHDLSSYILHGDLPAVIILLLLGANPNTPTLVDNPHILAWLYHMGADLVSGNPNNLAIYLWNRPDLLDTVDAILMQKLDYHENRLIRSNLNQIIEKYNQLSNSPVADINTEVTETIDLYNLLLKGLDVSEHRLDSMISNQSNNEPLSIVLDNMYHELVLEVGD